MKRRQCNDINKLLKYELENLEKKNENNFLCEEGGNEKWNVYQRANEQNDSEFVGCHVYERVICV
jgi:hypothetical protein